MVGEASLRELHDTDIVVHAGDGEADAFSPTTVDQPHGQITATRTEIEHPCLGEAPGPGTFTVEPHPRTLCAPTMMVKFRTDPQWLRGYRISSDGHFQSR